MQKKNKGKRPGTADGNSKAPPRKQLVVDSSACSVGDNTLPMDEVSDDVSERSFDDLSEAEEALDVADDSTSETPEKCDGCTESDTFETLIVEEYTEVETSPNLPAIDVKLVNILTNWLRTLPSREKVKDLFKKCMLPCNVEGLRPVKINLLVYEKLKPNFKVNDQRLRGINTFFA